MNASDLARIQKPLLTEAVMFFSEQGISREMLYPEFEALLDGLVTAPDFADETVEAVFLQINHRLHVRAAVFFTIDFDLDGYINRLWNMPLRNLAEKAGRGPDMGGGPIRLACLGFCTNKTYQPNLWKPGQRGGRADLRQAHAGETAEYLRQIGELQARLRQQEQESRQQLDHLRGEHADHLTVVQGELLDIKRELEEQQKINSLLRREVHKLQSRTTSGMG